MKHQRSLGFWAYAAQFSGLSFSLILLPLLIWTFPVERIALWYIFLALGSLGMLAEQSLEPAITRYVSYGRNGVIELPRYGMSPGAATGQMDIQLISAVVSAARWLHVRTSAINLAFFGLGGGIYLWLLASPTELTAETVRAWALFTAAQYIGCRLVVNIPILQGMGCTSEAYQALTLQRTIFVVTAIIGIVLYPRMEVIGIAQLIATTFGLGMAWLRVRRLLAEANTPLIACKQTIRSCIREILHGSVRLWITRFGAFQIVKSNLLLVSSFLGLQAAGSLALSMQAMEAITLLALTPLFSRLPRLYELRTQRLTQEIKGCVGNSLLVAWLTFIIGSIYLVWQGPDLLNLLGSRSSLLPLTSLLLLLLTGLLEMNHSFSATLLLLENRVPFMKAAVLSGLLTLCLSSLILSQTGLGILGALAVPFFVQLAYNNWKWPLEALRSLDTNYLELAKLGISWRPECH
jgi:O-antigen/teichoic acid export membrane protein